MTDAATQCQNPKKGDLMQFDFTLFPKLKGELKDKHLNDLHELRSESTKIIYSYPMECLIKKVYIINGSNDMQVHSVTRCIL